MRNAPKIGEVFGRLTVVAAARSKGHHKYWLCRCECGNEREVATTNLRSGGTPSCGCAWRVMDRAAQDDDGRDRSHRTRTREYQAWENARTRCENPNAPQYVRYGGRGISMCEEWRNDFAAFLRDMGPRPDGTSLDRIDVNGNYSPDNCRWATRKEQMRNRRNTVYLTIDGETMSLSDWIDRYGANEGAVRSRLKLGWAPKRALTTPSKKYATRASAA